MIDQKADVGKNFTDYQEEGEIGFFKLHLNNGHPWCGRTLSELPLSDELLVVLIVRKEGNIVPNGGTKLCTGDLLVIAAPSFEDRANMRMHELVIDYTSKMANTISLIWFFAWYCSRFQFKAPCCLGSLIDYP